MPGEIVQLVKAANSWYRNVIPRRQRFGDITFTQAGGKKTKWSTKDQTFQDEAFFASQAKLKSVLRIGKWFASK